MPLPSHFLSQFTGAGRGPACRRVRPKYGGRRHGERQAGPEWLSAAGLGRLQLGTATSTLPFRDLSLHISQRFATPSMVHLRGAHADVV